MLITRVTFIIPVLLFMLPCTSSGQRISGKVVDSAERAPLPGAWVVVRELRDSSAVAQAITDEQGDFRLDKVPRNQKLRLMIQYTGYRTFDTLFTLTAREWDAGTLALAFGLEAIREIIVEGERPAMTVKRDTVEFTAASFPTRP